MKIITEDVHCEYYYFEEVLKYLDIPDDYNVIVGIIHEDKYFMNVQKHLDNNKKNILIQLSEESEISYEKYYEKFYKIFRTYNTNNKFDNFKVFPIPCGPVTRLYFNHHKSEKPSLNIKTFMDRKKDIFFSGQQSYERNLCANRSKSFKKYNSYIELTNIFVGGLKLQEYYNMMTDAKICLVPRGVCIEESFRFFEAYLSNCIVITTLNFNSEKFNNIWYYKNCPAIILNDWNELSETIIDKALSMIEYYEKANKEYYENKISPKAVANYIKNNI